MVYRNHNTCRLFVAYLTETGLEQEMKAICQIHHVSLRDIYLDTRGPTVHSARLSVWWWLAYVIGKSGKEIARIFDRDASSIHYALAKVVQRAVQLGQVLTYETVHLVAKDLASSQQQMLRVRAPKKETP